MKNPVSRSMSRERQSTIALDVPRTLRPHENAFILKLNPGEVTPLAASALLREDAITGGRFSVAFEMSETAKVLINPVTVKVSAYLVPWLAFERFNGRDEFEASYSKQPFKTGDDVIPFIETVARGAEGVYPVMDALGLHAPATNQVSTMYLEAYNLIINYRNTQLSPDLPERTRLQTDFAAAHRDRGRHADIVPSFDEAAMEGAVQVDLLNQGSLPVHGLGHHTAHVKDVSSTNSFRETDGTSEIYGQYYGNSGKAVYMKSDVNGVPQVTVELEDAELSFSLAHIERAKKLQGFATLRERYSGVDNDAVINKLMDGIRMPEKMFEQPMYLGSEMTVFGYSKRYATDSSNLDESVVSGATMLSMQVATPRINTGGVLMFVAEIQPEQLFERQSDPFLTITDVDEYPQFIRDDGDEQKVDMVFNKEIDTAHTDPDGLFGYGPLNGKFAVQGPRIGTGFFRPLATNEFDEDRARIWDSTPKNPSLGADWYLTTDIPTGVFEYTLEEPFEASGRLELLISGNTVFGKQLVESDGDYEKVAARLPTADDQIEQPTI